MAIRLTHHRYIQRAGELPVQIRRRSHYSAGLGIPTTCKVSRESRAIQPVPGAVQNSAPFGHHADYSARRISLDVDNLPPAKSPSRRAPTLSCGCLGDWQRDKHSAAAPHRRQTRLVRGLSRCRSAYPSARWPAKLRRCGSQRKSTDKTDTSFGIRRWPFHRDGLLAKWQLDDHR